MWDNYPFFFFLKKHAHIKKREMSSNTKAHHKLHLIIMVISKSL